jgi:hypothetical protein
VALHRRAKLGGHTILNETSQIAKCPHNGNRKAWSAIEHAHSVCCHEYVSWGYERLDVQEEGEQHYESKTVERSRHEFGQEPPSIA